MFTFLTVYISYRTFYDVLLSKREKKKMLEIKNKIKIKNVYSSTIHRRLSHF